MRKPYIDQTRGSFNSKTISKKINIRTSFHSKKLNSIFHTEEKDQKLDYLEDFVFNKWSKKLIKLK